MQGHKETVKDIKTSDPSLLMEISLPLSTDINSEDMDKGTALEPGSNSPNEKVEENLEVQTVLNTTEMSTSSATPVSVDSWLHVI